MTIHFSNVGLLDLRCVTTMGVSVKEGTQPIGYFGTGLKYAIATILRNGGKVRLWVGMDEYTFGTVRERIREKEFAIIVMLHKGKETRLGFTTDLGRNWEPWMAFREIYSNMLDEGGEMLHTATPAPGRTLITISCPKFEAAAAAKEEYFLSSTPLIATSAIEFHNHGKKTPHVFYRGVRAGKLEKPSVFTFNILEETVLTEDRTIQNIYSIKSKIVEALINSNDASFIRTFIMAEKNTYEADLDIDYWAFNKPSDTFMLVAERCIKQGGNLNLSVLKLLAKHGKKIEPKLCNLLPSEAAQLAAAIAACKAMGYDVDDFPINVAISLGEPGVLARVDQESGSIWLTRDAISTEQQSLIGTLIEEWAHLRFGFCDESRAFQNWLLNNLVRLGRAYLAKKG